MRREILLVLTALLLSVALWSGRATLRLPLRASELELLLASGSLAGDRDLRLDHADRERLSRMGFEELGSLPDRPLRLDQPVYAALAGPLLLWLGDRGPLLLNALVLLVLLWGTAAARNADRDQFWWSLTYFLICAYPVWCARLHESVLIGGLLYGILCSCGEKRPARSGVALGLLLPGHGWLLPLALALSLDRPRRFKIAWPLAALAFWLVLPTPPAPPPPAIPVIEPAPLALAQSARALPLPPPAAPMAESLPGIGFLLGRAQGCVPYFLPWLVGLAQFLGGERERSRRRVLGSLLLCLALGEWSSRAEPVWGPGSPTLALLLPAFFHSSVPVRRLSQLLFVWAASSLFCAAAFLNPLHAAANPGGLLDLNPHRSLPLELTRLDPREIPTYEVRGLDCSIRLPGRDAWLGQNGSVLIRGKREASIVLLPSSRLPDLLLRAPVDLEATLNGARLSLEASKPLRIAWTSSSPQPLELRVRAASGLVPRLELDGGDGVDYIGLELWLTPSAR